MRMNDNYRLSLHKVYRSVPILICLGFLLCNVSCLAKSNKKQDFAPIDSVLRNEVGDSIASAIIQPRIVTFERIKAENDSAKSVVTSKRLSTKEKSILSFLMVSCESYENAPIVFGQFRPNVRFVFHSKWTTVRVEIDFGLKQLHINDAKDVCLYNMLFDDKRMLMFCNTLLKNDEYLLFMLKQE